ncbi:unnamed protein product [Onchocerca flexuosa]|uniref:MAP7 domain-containing protein 2 n=1 Tax=Onchocerca flexuosa TaxID=387005 RepID=A0A183GZY9_9BILA|nr:unnamed protein product [Onchocerca flexuosa]
MGDVIRNIAMNRSSYMGSARKDNAEEVAKRRAAIQQEIEQRQKLARKLQDEKMARAIAQKEERLLKQRKAQQREMLRAKAVLDRRTQVLAEKEKEKKEAMLAKVHALASRLTVQHKSRPVYAFGSSTPRELEYLTQLTREQKICDRKLMPSDRSSTAASGSSSHLTLTPPCDSRNYTPGTSMTGSLYVARPELKSHQKRISNCMTQSMMFTPKPKKTAKINQTFFRQSTAHRPIIAVKTAPSTVTEVSVRTKRLVQQHVPPVYEQRSRTMQSRPSKTETNASKAKPVPRTVHKSIGLQTNNETKAEAILKKLPGDEMNGTVMILRKDDVKVQDDMATTAIGNSVGIKEVNLIPDINETKKLDEKSTVVEICGGKKRTETASDASEFVRSDVRDGGVGSKEKIILESAPDRKVEEATVVEDTPLVDLSSKEEDNSVNEAKTNTAETVTMINMIIDQKAEMHEKGEEESDVLKEAGIELQDVMKISEIDHGTNSLMINSITLPNPLSLCPDSSQAKLIDEEQENVESAAKIFVQKESLVLNERYPEIGGDSRQKEGIIQKSHEIIEHKKENGVSAIEANESPAKEEVESTTQNDSTLKADEIEAAAEDLKLVEEKNSLEEKRRIQNELLEKEQREREIRKAKLASIMSRTRGNAPSVATVPPALHTENSDVKAVKHRPSISVLNEYTPMKNSLSRTTASVLQKLATTNPKLLSVLQRNGSSQSLADELSAVDPSMSITLPGQPVESIASHEGSSSTVRHLPFEPDVNHRPVAMK